MNSQFQLLMGSPYRGGTLVLQGSQLLTPCGNRVTQVDLAASRSATFPLEMTSSVRTMAASPDGKLLLAVDDAGRAAFALRSTGTLLHRVSFGGPVRAAAWSPDGQHLAVAVGRLVRVWKSPPTHRCVAPLELVRTYGHAHDDLRALSWSADSRWLVSGGRDLLVRVVSLDPLRGYRVPTLAGHRGPVVGAWFAPESAARAAGLLGKAPPSAYTLSADGTLHVWGYERDSDLDETAEAAAQAWGGDGGDGSDGAGSEDGGSEDDQRASSSSGSSSGSSSESDSEDASPSSSPSATGGEGAERSGDGASSRVAVEGSTPVRTSRRQTLRYAGGHWRLLERHRFDQRGARLTACAFDASSGLLAVGFSNGVFDLLQTPDLAVVHTLSLGGSTISSLAFGAGGEWIAVGCGKLRQLLVWEWRSETYVIKQQGHASAASAVAWSPDGAMVASGGDDARVKVWAPRTGFCFVTFADHSAAVTGVAFAPNGAAVLSSSRDGTVRAFDLVRYRCFRTLTTPEAAQFTGVAVDPAGDLVAAPLAGDFRVALWALKTGRLLELLSGHEAPVSGLAFAPGAAPLLATGSWDKTVRVWDVSSGQAGGEPLEHAADVLAIAWRPDARQLASATLDGAISLWDPIEGALEATISGRRDIAGGDAAGSSTGLSRANGSAGKAFTSLVYTADGSQIVAGGTSRYVCIYDTRERVLLRRVVLSRNVRLEGVLDRRSGRDLTDAGYVDEIDDSDGSGDEGGLVGAQRRAPGRRTPGATADAPASARARAIALSPTGAAWVAATPEGIALYAEDDGGGRGAFDPAALSEDATPAAAMRASARGAHARALSTALALRDADVARAVLLAAPASDARRVAEALPESLVPEALRAACALLQNTPHVEHAVTWVRALCTARPRAARDPRAAVGLKALAAELARVGSEVVDSARKNVYALDALSLASGAEGKRGRELARERAEAAGPASPDRPSSDDGVGSDDETSSGRASSEEAHVASDGGSSEQESASSSDGEPVSPPPKKVTVARRDNGRTIASGRRGGRGG